MLESCVLPVTIERRDFLSVSSKTGSPEMKELGRRQDKHHLLMQDFLAIHLQSVLNIDPFRVNRHTETHTLVSEAQLN